MFIIVDAIETKSHPKEQYYIQIVNPQCGSAFRLTLPLDEK